MILIMALLARMSGGGLGAYLLNKKGATDDNGKDLGGVMPIGLTWVPELLFAAGFGLMWFQFDLVCALVFAAVTLWSFLWMQSSTGPALQWGTDPADGMARPRRLSPVVNWISDRLGFERGDVNYCRTWMAIKGFLIGLPVGGILLAILWPLSYEIGHRLGDHKYSELLAGASAGLCILLFRAVLEFFNITIV